jgi:hypothetical protein
VSVEGKSIVLHTECINNLLREFDFGDLHLYLATEVCVYKAYFELCDLVTVTYCLK